MDYGRVRCGDGPGACCGPRGDAMDRRVFWYSPTAGGWLWSQSVSFPFVWRNCPWCDGPLPCPPATEDAVQGDGYYSGEEGG